MLKSALSSKISEELISNRVSLCRVTFIFGVEKFKFTPSNLHGRLVTYSLILEGMLQVSDQYSFLGIVLPAGLALSINTCTCTFLYVSCRAHNLRYLCMRVWDG